MVLFTEHYPIFKRCSCLGLNSLEKFSVLLSTSDMKSIEAFSKLPPGAQQSLSSARDRLAFKQLLFSQSITHLEKRWAELGNDKPSNVT